MKKINDKVLSLEDVEASELWEALKADREEDFFKNDNLSIFKSTKNFYQVATNMWMGMDMADPDLGEFFVFKFCCKSGVYTLELEKLNED